MFFDSQFKMLCSSTIITYLLNLCENNLHNYRNRRLVEPSLRKTIRIVLSSVLWDSPKIPQIQEMAC